MYKFFQFCYSLSFIVSSVWTYWRQSPSPTMSAARSFSWQRSAHKHSWGTFVVRSRSPVHFASQNW